MQPHSSTTKNNRVRTSNGRGKVFVFLSGVFVGTVLFPVILANFYAGFSIQQAFLSEIQQEHFDKPQGKSRKRFQKQQLLRNEKWSLSSSPNIVNEKSDQIASKETEHKDQNTEPPKTIVSSPSVLVETGKNESSSSCDIQEPSFFELARTTGTDKVKGVAYLPSCLEDDSTCTRPSCEREKCRPWGHFYHTMYQQQLSKFLDPNGRFQLLEIGYVRIVSLIESRCTLITKRYLVTIAN